MVFIFDKPPTMTRLAVGTSLIHKDEDQYYLITNRHNVTGRNQKTNKPLHSQCATPNALEIFLPTDEKLFDNIFPYFLPLYSDDDKPLWLVHPEYKNKTDIAILKFTAGDLSTYNQFLERKPTIMAVDVLAKDSLYVKNENLFIGDELFVLGYPKGISGGGILPIWKRATIATEPDLQYGGLPCLLIDAITREGMSGSPVFKMGEDRIDLFKDKPQMSVFVQQSNFVGIYSGRLEDSDIELQLGIVWKAYLIQQVIEGDTREDA